MIIAPDNIMGKIITNQWIWGYSIVRQSLFLVSFFVGFNYSSPSGIPSGKLTVCELENHHF